MNAPDTTTSYNEWTHNTLHTVLKDSLRTLAYLHEHRSMDNGKVYSSQQICDVGGLVDIIKDVCEIRKHLSV